MRGSDKRAVALEYNQEQSEVAPHGRAPLSRAPLSRAPRVTAKGKNRMAEKIEALAREKGVPVMDIPHLAESLFEVDIGSEIPEEFYSVTAQILSFVYSLEEKR
jgi:flagellar biosynthesis protein